MSNQRMKPAGLISLAVLLLASASLAAPLPALVKDINTLPDPEARSSPTQFQVLDGVAYFRAKRDFGAELWRSDGTPEGTFRVHPIAPDALTATANRLFFVAVDAQGGQELWSSDGTQEGTALLKDIRVGQGSEPGHLTPVGATLYFDACDDAHGRQLWRSDGTTEGTQMVKEIGPRSGSCASPTGTSRFGVLADRVYFFAADEHGFGLWTSDGTEDGTQLVRSVFPSFAAIAQDTPIFSALGRLWFVGDDAQHFPAVWVSDGTEAGTTQLRPGEVFADAFVRPFFVPAGQRVYFAATPAAGGTELWSSDGTDEGTALIDVRPGPEGSGPRSLTAVGDTLFFTANTATTPYLDRGELWRLDSETPRRLGEVTGATGLAVWKDALYFAAPDGECPTCPPVAPHLWKSDGTSAGTVPVTAAGTPVLVPHDFQPLGKAMLFGAFDPALGDELWTTDGTDAGTHLLEDIVVRNGSSFSGTTRAVGLGAEVYFPAFDGVPGAQFWASDGTEEGTRKIDLSPVSQSLAPQTLSAAGGQLFFFLYDGPQPGLWHSDGTTEGSQRVVDTAPVGTAQAVSQDLFFYSSSQAEEQQLWRSDGSESGTFAVATFGPFDSLSSFADVRGTLFFSNHAELWRSDGSAPGTYKIADLSGTINVEQVVGSRLFAATSLCGIYGGHPGQLWVSDGSAPGTRMVSDEVCPAPQTMAALHDKLYFLNTSGTPQHANVSLWRSDGTPAGTTPVRDLASKPAWTLMSGGRGLVIFTKNEHGDVLVWASDGTGQGTEVVTTIPFQGTTGTLGVDDRLSIGGRVYFVVTDTAETGGEYHRALWVTDGTSAGTHPLFDMPIFPLQSTAPVLSAGASRIFFSGYTADIGSEPWAYLLEASLCAGDCDGDGVTSAEDLLRAIGRALGDLQPTCAADGNGPITVDQLVKAVAAASGPCA